MAAFRVLIPLMTVVLTLLSWSQSLPVPLNNPHGTKEDIPLKRDRRAVGFLTIMGLSVTVASFIHGGICSFSKICGDDSFSELLDELQEKLDNIESGLSSLQTDVADIWQESKRSWYFDQIVYATDLRKELKTFRKKRKQNAFHKLKLQRFMDEVLGDNGNDKSVLEALYNIPRLVKEEGLIDQYLRTQKRKHEEDLRKAFKNTWKFIKKIFQLQTAGYSYVLLANALKYKNNHKPKKIQREINQCSKNEARFKKKLEKFKGQRISSKLETFFRKIEDCVTSVCNKKKEQLSMVSKNNKAYKQAVFDVCSMWKTPGDAKYEKTCSVIGTDHFYFRDQRKPQQDYIFTIIELFQFPALQVEVYHLENSKGLALAAVGDHSNEFWGYDTTKAKLWKIDHETMLPIKDFPLTVRCTEKENLQDTCRLIDISVGGTTNDDFRIALVTKENYLLLYKFGSSNKLVLVCRKWISEYILKSVVVCGNLFGYRTAYGWINLFDLNCNNLNPVQQKTWKLNRKDNGNHLLRCSNNGSMLLVQSSLAASHTTSSYFWGFAAIKLVNPSKEYSENLITKTSVQKQAEVVVSLQDLLPWHKMDAKSRLEQMAGMGFDSKGNAFFSSSSIGNPYNGKTSGTVAGIYHRLPNGKLNIIREFPIDTLIRLYDITVDENGFVYAEQQRWIGRLQFSSISIHKYNPALNFENVNTKWNEDQ